MDFLQLLGLLMRVLHLGSVIVLVGGLLYVRSAGLAPALAFRGVAWLSAAFILGSGLYNLLTKVNPPAGYHMWFGIKFLLALHVLGVALALFRGTADVAKAKRLITGVAVSATAIVIISAYLRQITLNQLAR
jgi:hypothetical protein